MDQNLEIKVTDGNIKVMCGDHEMANRNFEMSEWNKMMEFFQTSFNAPEQPFSYSEIDWWVSVDQHGRGNWKRGFYKIIVNYKNGFKYKFKNFKQFNQVFGTSFNESTKFENFKSLMIKRSGSLCKNGSIADQENIVQSEFDVS